MKALSPFPGISVAPAIETIFTYNGGHTISCVFSDILEAITGVTWAPATQQQDWYSLEDGTYSSATKSQTSTLYIHSSVVSFVFYTWFRSLTSTLNTYYTILILQWRWCITLTIWIIVLFYSIRESFSSLILTKFLWLVQ